jgi:hypothetical protein
MGNFKGKPSYGEIIHWTIHQLLKLGNIMEYHMEFHDIILLIMAHNLIKPMVDHEQYDHKWVV